MDKHKKVSNAEFAVVRNIWGLVLTCCASPGIVNFGDLRFYFYSVEFLACI